MAGTLSDVIAGLSDEQKDAIRRFRLHRGGPQYREAPEPNLDLSSRELEVLEGIAAGETEATVATRLQISRDTVHDHMRSVRRKLGVHSAAHAVAEGFRRGCLL